MTAQENEPLTPLNIITFNVNGLGLEAKRNSIFKKIRQKKQYCSFTGNPIIKHLPAEFLSFYCHSFHIHCYPYEFF